MLIWYFVGSGDHDMCVPFTGSEAWTRSLGYQILDEWRPWFSDGQVAGYAFLFWENCANSRANRHLFFCPFVMLVWIFDIPCLSSWTKKKNLSYYNCDDNPKMYFLRGNHTKHERLRKKPKKKKKSPSRTAFRIQDRKPWLSFYWLQVYSRVRP